MDVNTVLNYYNTYQEDNRLTRDKSNHIEYHLTYSVIKDIIDKTFNKEIRLIDVGCGSGYYTIAFAKYCDKVIACDIVKDSLRILKSKIDVLGINNVELLCQNALSLDSVSSNEYDVVLCMGPLYHINQEEERKACLAEMARILKKKGIIIFSYLNTSAVWMNVVKNKLSIKDYLTMDNDCILVPPFYFTSPQKIISELENLGWNIKMHCAVDPISCFFPDTINSFNDDEYEMWLKTMKTKMHKPLYLQLSSHNIVVASK